MTDGWLSAVAQALADLPGLDGADAVVQTVVSGSPARAVAFHAIFETGRLTVLARGRHYEPDVVLNWSYEDFEALWFGELSLEVAFMRGQVKVEGDHALLFDGLRPVRSSARLLPALAALRVRA